MTAFAPTFDQSRAYFESRLGRSFPARDRVAALCPFHADKKESLSINFARGLWKCHACNTSGGLLDFERRLTNRPDPECWDTINATIGRPVRKVTPFMGGTIVETYPYRDAAGNVVFEAVRREPKDFRQRRPDGKGGHIWNMDGITCVPFNLPDLITANVVLVTEGEKDAIALTKAAAHFPNGDGALRYTATCNVGGAGKWLDEYSVYLIGKKVFVFQDNDKPGRRHAQQVCTSIQKYAQIIRLVELPDLAEHGDVSDYLKTHSPSELFELMKCASRWTPHVSLAGSMLAKDAIWTAERMSTFLTASEADIAWLVTDILAPGCLTQMFAPRGLGKSLLAEYWAVHLASAGKRVLILDRDNPRRTLRTRLRGFGANKDIAHLSVISRESCPPLTKPEQWAAFPYADYDLVIVDSLDAMAEGVGEQDSSKPARAMAPLLDICHRENGPAVLLLGNTIKSAAHSRGCGIIEDRADIVYELRDGTDFRPSGCKPWIEELPAQGASEWAARSARRKGRPRYRLALIATKFRDGEEPAPRMLEICTEGELWIVTDVTASVDAAGEAERSRVAEEKAARVAKGVAALADEIDSRQAAGQPAIQKTAAEEFLMAAGFTRKDARAITESDSFASVPVSGKGHPVELHRHRKDVTAEMRECLDPSRNDNSAHADFRRPHLERTAEIDPSQTLINKGDFQPAISAADPTLAGGKNDDRLFDVEI